MLLKSRYLKIELTADLLKKDLAELKKREQSETKYLESIGIALGVVQELALLLQNRAQIKIAAVGTSALKIFGDEYSLRIDFEVKRSKTAATFIVKKGEVEIEPMDSGGGIVDVISFALRLASILAKPEEMRRRLVILDEPFKYVSVEFRPAIQELIHKLAEKFDIQFIIVSAHHQD